MGWSSQLQLQKLLASNSRCHQTAPKVHLYRSPRQMAKMTHTLYRLELIVAACRYLRTRSFMFPNPFCTRAFPFHPTVAGWQQTLGAWGEKKTTARGRAEGLGGGATMAHCFYDR